jgi:DDE superfamily endonuclease
MVAMGCYRPDGSAARLLVGFHRGSYDTAALVEALTGRPAFLGGAPVNLVWDNRKAHKSTAMREFLADQDWLGVDDLPASAPELHPMEGRWANLKGGELANRCCPTAEEVIATAQVAMIRVRRNPQLPLSFLRQTGLTLGTPVLREPVASDDVGQPGGVDELQPVVGRQGG